MDLDKTVSDTVKKAADYLLSVQRTDHDSKNITNFWCGEVVTNSTVTSEYVMFCQILGVPIDTSKASKILRYYRERQNPVDGSWTVAHGVDGDISTTLEAYLALTILGVDREDQMLVKAKQFILKKGGPPRVRIFTKVHLALFGLLSWDDIPVFPAELMLLPPQFPINIYNFAMWARATIVPLLVINHYRPVYPLPNTRCHEMMDELWPFQRDSSVRVPYVPPLRQVWKKYGWSLKTLFTAVEPALKYFNKINPSFLRRYALSKCMKFISTHQDKEGDSGGFVTPMLYGALAMTLEGYRRDSHEVRGFLAAAERLSWESDGQFRMQICSSPIWDTALSVMALLDCGHDAADGRVEGAIQWLLDQQLLGAQGDWQVYRPNVEPGGWAFEYVNSWCPDTDDTSTTVLCILKFNPSLIHSYNLQLGIKWVLGLQNDDGGWGAFEADNDKYFLNDIPFLDMDACCDPSSPDVTGHILEMLGTYLKLSENFKSVEPHESLRRATKLAIDNALKYLRDSQEIQGSWYARWGVNYICGTGASLCGLAAVDLDITDPAVSRAVEWLKGCQNENGGWGESVHTYLDKSSMGTGVVESTATQTAWAVMALVPFLPATDPSIQGGIQWLVRNFGSPANEPSEVFEGGVKVPATQTVGGTWSESSFTATGFPGHMYFSYRMYRHYFPMMALGRYLQHLNKHAHLK